MTALHTKNKAKISCSSSLVSMSDRAIHLLALPHPTVSFKNSFSNVLSPKAPSNYLTRFRASTTSVAVIKGSLGFKVTR
jgi:hypothetical protein